MGCGEEDFTLKNQWDSESSYLVFGTRGLGKQLDFGVAFGIPAQFKLYNFFTISKTLDKKRGLKKFDKQIITSGCNYNFLMASLLQISARFNLQLSLFLTVSLYQKTHNF
eukprot:TRINITY_DN19629_c0_g1_i1.p2 TRINITY_DN19629_c0_g1~~TRINITY_DN19629_c0_g1_i1.p2  ORF type:complete len:110 (-),score=10.36 TRINITY_DN19629_c0_g1_i1:616-945(-)